MYMPSPPATGSKPHHTGSKPHPMGSKSNKTTSSNTDSPDKKHFEDNMNKMPYELADHILSFVPKNNKTKIAMIPSDFDGYGQWSIYKGPKDDEGNRYNNLPEHYKSLASKLIQYGTFEQVRTTLDRWYNNSNQKWEKFLKEPYPHGKAINPYAIEKILKKEEKKHLIIYKGGRRTAKKYNRRSSKTQRNQK
jgi:hypothetical protein